MTRPLLLFILVFFTVSGSFGKPGSTADSSRLPRPFETDTLLEPVPINRALFVDRVKAQIRKADLKDGAADQVIELEDSGISANLTSALLRQAPLIWVHIENMPVDHAKKVQYLHALEQRLRYWNSLPLSVSNAVYTRRAVSNFENLLKAVYHSDIDHFISENQNIISIDNSDLLDDFPEQKAALFLAVGKAQPADMILRLQSYAGESYAQPIISDAARVAPDIILKYALSTGSLRTAVRKNQDPYVKTLVQIADQSPVPQKVLPFAEEIFDGRRSIKEVNTMANNPVAYYKALVALRLKGSTSTARPLDDELQYRGLQFVRTVNELHDQSAPVRFKCLADFGAEDLYFMMIGSQEEIYTSSFIWMFDRMMAKMKPLNGAAFLEKVQKIRFRTFIRMAAGYNTLSPYLNTMDESQRSALMKEFVSGLEKGPIDDLQDAVDVADAFGSLTDPKLISFLQNEIRQQYEARSNQKGTVIYSLLSTIFNSSDSSDKLNNELAASLPPITYVPIDALRDKEGRIVQQVFFYGDKDGMGAFNGYLNLFRNGKWKIERNKYWATVSSLGKNKIIIYVNVPLPEEATENDVFAQQKLQDYIDSCQLKPSIIIHRGHSYYLPTTLEHLTPSAKIVILGSCGGYHNLSTVLNSSPDANIISSKQVGAYRVNTPIIHTLNEILLAGKDVNWIDMWKSLSRYFSAQGAVTADLFSDYVPPNKNLGAIFIKAYKKQVALSETK